MKRLLTIALAVLFVTSLSSIVLAERTALSISGRMELLSRYEENTATLGESGLDNRVEQKINLDVDADMTDNVTAHIGLEMDFVWADDTPPGEYTGADRLAGTGLNDRVALGIDEAYIKIDELLIEQLSITAGVMNVEYSLRDDGNAMFLSVPELGAFKATLDYDPLYVDILIGKLDETRANPTVGPHLDSDMDAYVIAVEYYLENESKIQVIFMSLTDKEDDISVSEYSAGVTYNVTDDLEIFAQIGGQGGEIKIAGADNDTKCMAYNLGVEYTFSSVNLTPYVGISYQSFGGDKDAGKENWVNVGDVDETIVLEADGDLRDNNQGPVGKILTSNYSVLRIVGGCQIDEKTALDAGIGLFSLTDKDAAEGDGVLNGSNVNGGEAAIGTEIDVKVTHQLTDDLEVAFGLGYVASGKAIEDTPAAGGEKDALVVIAASAVLTF